jgi:hypothetical protein
MDSEFAECSDYQSGQRFLEGSVPRLIRHAAFCETAGGRIGPLPAGKDQNPSQEFEGGALIGRTAPVHYLACLNTEQSKQQKQWRS